MKARKYYVFMFLFCLSFFVFSCQQEESKSLDITEDVSSDVMQKAQKIVESSDLIIVGSITEIYDGTHPDAGMSYDVEVEKVIHGKYDSKELLFRSSGWIGYAEYKEGEKVLLFLRYFGEPSPELMPIVLDRGRIICYIRNGQVEGYSGADGPLGKMSLEQYIELIKQAGKE